MLGEAKTLARGFVMVPHRLRALVFFQALQHFYLTITFVIEIGVCGLTPKSIAMVMSRWSANLTAPFSIRSPPPQLSDNFAGHFMTNGLHIYWYNDC